MSSDVTTTNKLLGLLAVSAELREFTPSDLQKQIRAAFHASLGPEGLLQLSADTDLQSLLKYGVDRRIAKWWGDEQFRSWFLNRDAFRNQVEYVSGLALDALQEILTSPATSNSTRLAAAKLALELGGKMPSQQEKPQDKDDPIAKMDRAELSAYIQKLSRVSPSPTPINNNKESINE